MATLIYDPIQIGFIVLFLWNFALTMAFLTKVDCDNINQYPHEIDFQILKEAIRRLEKKVK
jgi:hypothetical protein